MFDITSSKLLILGIVALLVIGPKDLPALLRTIGKYMGIIKRHAAEFRAQFDEAMRESELEQREAERDRHGGDRLVDAGGDRGIRLVDLEDSGRAGRCLDQDRNIRLERLHVLARAPLVVESGDALRHPAGEGSLQLARVADALADERVIRGVGDNPARAPEHHSQYRSDQLALECGVELGPALRAHGPGEVGVGERRRQPVSDIRGVSCDDAAAPLLGLAPDDPEDGDPRECERDRAVDGETQDEAGRPPRRRRRRNGHATGYRCGETLA